MLVHVQEAAKLAGKSRKTLYRHIASGKLSVTRNSEGVTQVETSELLRVYGALKEMTQNDTPENDTASCVTGDSSNRAILKELAALRKEIAELKEQLLLPAPMSQPDTPMTQQEITPPVEEEENSIRSIMDALKAKQAS